MGANKFEPKKEEATPEEAKEKEKEKRNMPPPITPEMKAKLEKDAKDKREQEKKE